MYISKVIRCKHCKYCIPRNDRPYCDVRAEYVAEDYFCADAKKIFDKTLYRFSYLYDKNGIKIYEGDIVRTKYGRLGIVTFLQSPCFNGFDINPVGTQANLSKKAPDKSDLWSSENLEVVGNIEENLELLA